ncbi:MAG TPA: hypothetical protein VIY48_18835 [Candidatus Paceibacterota bacterium]
MNSQFLKDAFGWGTLLWIIGYVLGFVFFFVVPPAMVGWVIMPIGVAITLWVLFTKIHGPFSHFVFVGVVWAIIAVVLDYFLLVQLLHPADGYYKLDVYIYYALTLLLPIAVGWFKKSE